MVDVSSEDCGMLIEYIHNRCGMNLKNKEVMMRLKAERELDRLHIDKISDYIDLIEKDPQVKEALLENTATGYTYFMRERDQFQILGRDVYESSGDSDEPIVVWSAGCATGEECYSAAIVASECAEMGRLKRPVKILGSDISDNQLSIGEEGCYLSRQLMKVSHGLKFKYFDKMEDGRYKVKDKVKEMVTFTHHNLIGDFSDIPKCDVIICRNVLVYMDTECRKTILRHFYDSLKPGGFLFLGNAETVHVSQNRWTFKGHSVYQKKEEK